MNNTLTTEIITELFQVQLDELATHNIKDGICYFLTKKSQASVYKIARIPKAQLNDLVGLTYEPIEYDSPIFTFVIEDESEKYSS